MNKIVSITALLAIFSLSAFSQCERIVFTYDNAGNRIKREYKTECEEGPIVEMSPSSPSLELALEPNPTSNDFKISISQLTENKSSASTNASFIEKKSSKSIYDSFTEGDLSIIDNNGKTMLRKKIYSPEEVIDISQLANGIYFCRVIFEDRVVTKRFMVIK